MSDGAGFVLGASGLLAHLLAEPAGEVVRDALAEQAAVMVPPTGPRCSRGWRRPAQIPTRSPNAWLPKWSWATVLTVVALTGSDGPANARLRPTPRHLGLSVADRACLALAQRLGLPVLTTDRAWAQLQIGVAIRLARP